jgi:heme-degrading monooxygenase HmoA
MVARLWKGRARPELAEAYQRHVTTSVFPPLQQLHGYIGARVMRRSAGSLVEFLVITEWTSVNAIRAFAGDVIERAVVEPAAREVLVDFDTHVEHFEVVEWSSQTREFVRP